jgi:hypothetical protein
VGTHPDRPPQEDDVIVDAALAYLVLIALVVVIMRTAKNRNRAERATDGRPPMIPAPPPTHRPITLDTAQYATDYDLDTAVQAASDAYHLARMGDAPEHRLAHLYQTWQTLAEIRISRGDTVRGGVR